MTCYESIGSIDAMKRGCMALLQNMSRWGAVALAAFYLNFVAVHLATEMHFHSHGEEHAHLHDAHPEPDHDYQHEHDHEGGGHEPHDASEHLLDVALKAADVFQPPVLLVAVEYFIVDAPVFFTLAQHIFERERPPAESFPDPQQPRAPPLV